MAGFIPQVVQGNLNRAAVHVVVASFPALSVTAGFMSKGGVHVSYEGDAVTQIPTMTGVVDSPEPYLMTTLTVSILRTQALTNAWAQQQATNSTIGNVTIISDSTSYAPIVMQNTAIQNINNGPYDGTDPTVVITLRGQVQINSSMWASLTGLVAAIL
jgi:hypothetical protein